MHTDLSPRFVVNRGNAGTRPVAVVLVLASLTLVTLPWWGDASLMRSIVEIICFLVLAQMWNLMAGYGGQISVGQQAFVGLGGYGLFILAQHNGINPFWAVPMAGVGTALVAIPMSDRKSVV